MTPGLRRLYVPRSARVEADSAGKPLTVDGHRGRGGAGGVGGRGPLVDAAPAGPPLLRVAAGRRLQPGRLPQHRQQALVPAARLMAAGAPYVELHAHSAFSFLDGASTPAELAGAAADLGYSALALTDHDGIWGSMEFVDACQGIEACEGRGQGDHRRRDHGRKRPPHAPGRRRERLPQPLPTAHGRALPHARQLAAERRAAVGDPRAGGGARRGAGLPLGVRGRGDARRRLGEG